MKNKQKQPWSSFQKTLVAIIVVEIVMLAYVLLSKLGVF